MKKRNQGVFAFDRIEATYCIRETTLTMWFLIVLLAFLLILFVNIFEDYRYTEYLIPTYNMNQCLPNSMSPDDTRYIDPTK